MELSATGARPRQVWLASIMLAVFGALGLVVAFLLLAILNDDASHGQSVSGGLYFIVALQAVVSAAQIGSGAFVWLGRSWARTLAIGICVVNILGALLGLASGAFLQVILGVVLNIALIRLLMHEDVVEWCR